MSWYKSAFKFSERQTNYLKLLEKTFIIRDAQGRKVKYVLQNFQKDFHAHSLFALDEKDWKNRLVIKSRGIGLSVMCMIDYIMYASLFFDNTVFPITSYRQDASIELLRKAKNIIQDSEDDNGITFNADVKPTGIYFRDTGSQLKAMPGGSEEALRSYRAPAVLFDELAFYLHGDEVFAAGENVVTESGAIDIVSTVMGHNDFFYNLYQNYKRNNLGYVFEFPLFEKVVFNPVATIKQQKGQIIAPWFNKIDLEKKRIRDINKFLREYMCQPVDEGQKFYPLPLIINCVENKIEVKGQYKVMGIDVASIQDWAAIAEFTDSDGVWYQTYLDKQKMPLPELQDYVDKLIELRKPTLVRIDATGQGLQLSQYLTKKYGTKVTGVHFSIKIDSQKVREFAAINFRTLMYEKKVKLINDEDEIRHLNSWNATLSKSDDDTGHGDIAIACELALLPQDKIPREKTVLNSFIGFAKRF